MRSVALIAAVAFASQLSAAELYEVSTAQSDVRLGSNSIVEALIKRAAARKQTLSPAQAMVLPVTVKITTEQGNFDADLSKLNVVGVEIEAGQGDVKLKMPAKGTTEMTITTDQGGIDIYVPRSRAVVVTDSALEMGELSVDRALENGPMSDKITVDVAADQGDVSFIAE
jgi:hypothetical protein